MSETQFQGLKAIVQYRRNNGSDGWRNMAAFDLRHVAERYCADCEKSNPPWEYRVVDVVEDQDPQS